MAKLATATYLHTRADKQQSGEQRYCTLESDLIGKSVTLVTVAGLMEMGAVGSTASSFIPSLKQWAAMAGWSCDNTNTHVLKEDNNFLHTDQILICKKKSKWFGSTLLNSAVRASSCGRSSILCLTSSHSSSVRRASNSATHKHTSTLLLLCRLNYLLYSQRHNSKTCIW